VGLSGYEVIVSDPLDPGSILNSGENKQVVTSCSPNKVAIGGGANVVVDSAHSDSEAEIVWTGIVPQMDSNGVPRGWAAEAHNKSAFAITLNVYCICVDE
jgi:hypothetical protein